MPLSDSACKNAKPKDKVYKLADSEGLYLLVHPNGSKYWRMKYYYLGLEKSPLAFGKYPDISLLNAREKRAEAKKLLREGIDPGLHKKRLKQTAVLNLENTFSKIALEWHQKEIKQWKPYYAEQIKKWLKDELFTEFGNRLIDNIDPLELLTVLQKTEARSTSIAHKLLGYVIKICRYAILTKRATRNPAYDLGDGLKPNVYGHYATLEPKDLPQFIKDFKENKARLLRQTFLATKIMMYTFTRTSELVEVPRQELLLQRDRWIIDGGRMKMKNSHIVPLAPQVKAMFEELIEIKTKWKGKPLAPEDYIFMARGKPYKPLSENAILYAIYRMGYKGKMTGHGFRSLAMTTIKEELGYSHEVVDRQLAHKYDDTYDRAKLLPERTKMMNDWASYLDRFFN